MSEPQNASLHRVTGRVVEAWRDRAIVALEIGAEEAGRGERCAGCRMCAVTPAGSVELRAWLPPGLSVAAGDRVEVEVRSVAPHRAALLLYGMPLAAFLGATIVVWYATGSEGASALAGFGALAAAFLTLYLVERGRGASARVLGPAPVGGGPAGGATSPSP